MLKYKKFVTHTNETMGKETYDAYESKSIEEPTTLIEGTKLADHAFVLHVMGHLLGKVLTTVEATTANEKQAKAIKDLMRGHFSSEMEFVASMMYDQEELNKVAEESVAGLSDDEIMTVEIEEVLGVKQ